MLPWFEHFYHHVVFDTDGELVPAATDVKLVVRVLYESWTRNPEIAVVEKTATCKNKVAAAEFMAKLNKTVPVPPCNCPPDIEFKTLREAEFLSHEVVMFDARTSCCQGRGPQRDAKSERTRELREEYANGRSRRSAFVG
ncbi:hypothetical protein H9P43_004322 [Blastocladiella emersonii ATCC 22665]|nr:hypothetical protein H9P43_004322 [Blastocladiella emersonii ATCC 22665]